MRHISFVFCLFLSLISCAYALVLEDFMARDGLATTLEDKTLGYFLGSFDPLHKGHEDFVRQALESGACDYVLMYPAWGGDSYKNRTPVDARLEMLFATYARHPKVIVTRLSPLALQETLTTACASQDGKKKCVLPRFKGLQIVGMVGSDTALDVSLDSKKAAVFMTGLQVTAKYKNHTLGGVMALPVKSFLVHMRAGQDIKSLRGIFAGRPITQVFENVCPTLSSTRIRVSVSKGEEILSFVNEEVSRIIKEKGLYQRHEAPLTSPQK